MIQLAADNLVAERQISAILFMLVAFGYIDGDFDETERAFVDRYLDGLIDALVDDVPDPGRRREYEKRYRRRYHKAFEQIDAFVEGLLTEPLSEDETREEFVRSRLKLRAFEIFARFDEKMQHQLFECVEELIAVDGQIHDEEQAFRDEVHLLLKAPLPREAATYVPVDTEARGLDIQRHRRLAPRGWSHDLLDAIEVHYHDDDRVRRKQAEEDRELIERAISLIWEFRTQGKGMLEQRVDLSALEGLPPFLDDFVYAIAPGRGERYELCVLGDLHGCYSCLKAALFQFGFFEKVEAYRRDPRRNPNPKLVLLGDYIDRGRFSLEGVLRAALTLYVTYPEHVYLLRGNHEWYIERGGSVMSGVRPSEAITSWIDLFPDEHFRTYVRLFDNLPGMLIFDRTLFVHGGIPRDDSLERYEDLSFLNDPYVRFQMMWSDPSDVAHVPRALQLDTARFAFGRQQFRRFMGQIGANTLIRGHEKIGAGFQEVFDDDEWVRLLTVFSAGGLHNRDLPPRSPYRKVTPMALTLKWGPEGYVGYPWEIEYEAFNSPESNRFRR